MEQDDHCRICLNIKTDLFSIYSYEATEYLPTVIYQISGVKISSNLEPGAQICTLCASALVAAQTIILSCQEAEEYKTRNRWRRRSGPDTSTSAFSEAEEENEIQLEYQQETENTVTNAELPYEHYERHFEADENAFEPQFAECVSDDDDEAEVEELEAQPAVTVNASAATSDQHRDPSKTARFYCDRCDFQTRTGKKLIEHKRNLHQIDDPLIYACTLCSQRFAWKPTLYRHIQRDHQLQPPEKRYACEICNKTYMRQVHLREHMRQTHGPRRYKCADPQCDQTFTRAFTLRRHFQAAHASTQPYHCADCNKYFKIYGLWKYHNEVVHKNETVYCPRCGYPFRYKEKLEEHLQKEACKRSIIPCTYCQRRFTTKNGLREHLKKIHQMTNSNKKLK